MPGSGSACAEVFVEIPKGSRNKFEWDHHTGRFRLDRMLFSSVQYPGDYGFVPDTWAEDGDPLDALVILGEPTFPGCTITGRIIGLFHMSDEKGPDAKLLTVPDSDPRWQHIQELDDVPDHLLAEIAHFFSIYKDLERKGVTVAGFTGREQGVAEVRRSRERFDRLETRPRMP